MRSPMTTGLTALLVGLHGLQTAVSVVWGWQSWTVALGGQRDPLTRIRLGGRYYASVNDGEWWRVVTGSFVHLDLLHLLTNVVALAVLGRLVEPRRGWRVVLLLFGGGAVFGSLVSHFSGVAQADGSSGGAYALFAFVLVTGWRERVESMRYLVALTALFACGLGLDFVLPWVDVASHVGGGLLGAAVGLRARMSSGRSL